MRWIDSIEEAIDMSLQTVKDKTVGMGGLVWSEEGKVGGELGQL